MQLNKFYIRVYIRMKKTTEFCYHLSRMKGSFIQVGEIIGRFQKKDLKFSSVNSLCAERHYANHLENVFFKGLFDYIASGAVVATVWEGNTVVLISRQIIGATNSTHTAIDTIHGDYAIRIGRNFFRGWGSVVDCAREEICVVVHRRYPPQQNKV